MKLHSKDCKLCSNTNPELMPALSVCMIVKNEEKYLRDCLNSLLPVSPEIIIVDTGSTDATKNIAAEFAVRLYDMPWRNNFSDARNFALSKASGRWILYIDADERLSPQSTRELARIVKSDDLAGIYCNLQSVDSKGGRPNMMKYIRLFHSHPDIRFKGRVHEQIFGSLYENGYSIHDSGIKLIHLGYDVSREELKSKAERNLKLLLEDYNDQKDGYTAFQIASSYGMMQDNAKATEYFKSSLTDSSLAPHYNAHANRFLAAIALENNDVPLASKLISDALNANANAPLVNMIAAKICFRLNDIQSGFDYFLKGFNNNLDLLQGRTVSPFDIMIDPVELALEGISYAVNYQNLPVIEFYLRQLEKSGGNADASVKKETGILRKFFSNTFLSPAEIDFLICLFQGGKEEVYCELITRIPNKSYALKLLSGLHDNFQSSQISAALSLLYEQTGDEKNALQFATASLSSNSRNLPLLLRTVSLLIKADRIEDCFILLSDSKDIFKENTAQVQIIDSVINKIQALVNTVPENK